MGANFYADLDSIRERLTPNAHPVQLPIGAEENFLGIIDLFERKAWIYKDDMGKTSEDTSIPENMKEKVEEYRRTLLEAIVEQDENLLAQYLEGKEPPLDELKKTLRKACILSKLVPVFCGSALKNKGVQFLLDGVIDYLPSPLDIPAVKATDPKNNEIIERKADDTAPFTALAFKVASDPFVGKLCFFRVYSGKIAAGSYVLNTTTGERERIGRIVRLHANQREEVSEVYAGEIAAAVGLKSTFTGHTICDPDHPAVLESIKFPEPVISLAIEPKTKADQEKMGTALQRLAEEDPTFRIKSNEETGETIISGMGNCIWKLLLIV